MEFATPMNPYAPANLTSDDLALERYIYIGLSLSLVVYGFAILLFLSTAYLFLYQSKQQQQPQYHSRNTAIVLFVYLCITFSLLTAETTCHTLVKTRALIDYREYPGGPRAYLRATNFSPASAVAMITKIFVNYLAQGLMLYRCYVIFRDKIWFVATPVILFCATMALGLTLIWELSQPMNTVWDSARISLPYFILSTVFNIVVTTLIFIRLLLHRRQMDVLYSKSCSKDHLGASAILIESFAMSAVYGLVSTITYATKVPAGRLFLNSWTQVQFIACCLVIYQLAKKRAWTRRLAEQFSTRSLNQLPIIHVETVY